MTPTQVIESLYDAFQRGDIASIVNRVSPVARWRQPKVLPWGGEYSGAEGAAEFFFKLNAEMETTAFRAHENIETGDDVFSFGYYEARSRKTGRTAGSEWMFRWRVRDGKIVLFDSYMDTATLLAALESRATAAR